MRPAADDDFVECQNAHLITVLVLPSRRRVRPAADDDFVKSYCILETSGTISDKKINTARIIGAFKASFLFY